jgi:hypothetical protein
MIGRVHDRRRAWVGRALIVIGLACLIFYGIVTVHTWRFQRAAKARVEEMVTIERPRGVREHVPSVAKPLHTGEIIGRVEIPRLGLSPKATTRKR